MLSLHLYQRNPINTVTRKIVVSNVDWQNILQTETHFLTDIYTACASKRFKLNVVVDIPSSVNLDLPQKHSNFSLVELHTM